MLRNYCILAEQTTDYFVGMRWQNGHPQVVFPHGYRLSNDDAECRRDIFRLLATLQKFAKQKNGESYRDDASTLSSIPLVSYQYILYDFLNHGYYEEKEFSYHSAKRGKICWKRTIQQEHPIFQGNSPIYLNFRVKRAQNNDNHLLTHIHRYCVYQAFSRFGWLFFQFDFLPEKPLFAFNKSIFQHALQQALNNTFNDEKRRLLTAMMHIVQEKVESIDVKHEALGVNYFAPVWERMVDYVFGESEKDKFFPHATWHILQDDRFALSSALEPDTIMKFDGKFYVLDAKYYQYGITRDPRDLPNTSSIQKQITYGQHIAEKVDREHITDVFNAFIMPYNGGGISNIEFACVGTGDWLRYDNSTPHYAYVLGILMDTKWLMAHYIRHNNIEIAALAEKLETSLACYLSQQSQTLACESMNPLHG